MGCLDQHSHKAESEILALPSLLLCSPPAWGARAVLQQLTYPIRSQIGWLIPQPDVNYGIVLDNLNILGRRDGIVVQPPAGTPPTKPPTAPKPKKASARSRPSTPA